MTPIWSGGGFGSGSAGIVGWPSILHGWDGRPLIQVLQKLSFQLQGWSKGRWTRPCTCPRGGGSRDSLCWGPNWGWSGLLPVSRWQSVYGWRAACINLLSCQPQGGPSTSGVVDSQRDSMRCCIKSIQLVHCNHARSLSCTMSTPVLLRLCTLILLGICSLKPIIL